MYKKILVPIDHTDKASWQTALPLAAHVAKLHGAELRVIAVVPETVWLPNLPENYGEGVVSHVRRVVEDIVDDCEIEANVTVHEGSIYREILKDAHQSGTDLIMMASPRGTSPDFLLGPNAARVVRHANCSVQIVRG